MLARVRAVPSVVEPAAVRGAGYGGRRINPFAAGVAIALHGLAIAGLLHIHHRAEEKPSPRLTVVDLQAPPPPPAETPKSPLPKSPIVAPRPLLQIPQPSPPQIVTVTEPPPEPVEIAVAAPPPAPPAPPAPPSIVTSSDLGTRMVSGEPPRYPIESRRKHEQGTVVLALTLDFKGAVASIAIARSSGYARLDDAALRAVRRWRWSPTTRDGQAVMVKGMVEIPFVLAG